MTLENNSAKAVLPETAEQGHSSFEQRLSFATIMADLKPSEINRNHQAPETASAVLSDLELVGGFESVENPQQNDHGKEELNALDDQEILDQILTGTNPESMQNLINDVNNGKLSENSREFLKQTFENLSNIDGADSSDWVKFRDELVKTVNSSASGDYTFSSLSGATSRGTEEWFMVGDSKTVTNKILPDIYQGKETENAVLAGIFNNRKK